MTAYTIRNNRPEPEALPGLMEADEEYRKQMEAANREFVARLQWAMAA